MKTLFLFTVLFVLLAFAFKSPEQSAWDFAKKVGSNVIHKINEKEESNGTSDFDRKFENQVANQIEDFRKSMEIEKKNTEPYRAIPKTSPKKRNRFKQPKPKGKRDVAKPLEILPPPEKTPEKVTTVVSGPETNDISHFTVNPAPSLPARPVQEVVVEPNDEITMQPVREAIPEVPQLKVTAPRISTPLDTAELAKMGARFDRASRLLSEIK